MVPTPSDQNCWNTLRKNRFGKRNIGMVSRICIQRGSDNTWLKQFQYHMLSYVHYGWNWFERWTIRWTIGLTDGSEGGWVDVWLLFDLCMSNLIVLRNGTNKDVSLVEKLTRLVSFSDRVQESLPRFLTSLYGFSPGQYLKFDIFWLKWTYL